MESWSPPPLPERGYRALFRRSVLQATLRQLTQFGYDLDRLQYVASDEVELLARVRGDYDRFIAIVTRVVELAGAGRVAEARQVQRDEARVDHSRYG